MLTEMQSLGSFFYLFYDLEMYAGQRFMFSVQIIN